MNRINGKVGYGGANYPQDVKVVQNLINSHANKMPGFQKLVVDGKIGPKTINAIKLFQSRVVKVSNPDGRVDPGGKTWNALVGGIGTTPTPVAPPTGGGGMVSLTVSHGNKIPTVTQGLTSNHGGLYESTFVLSGGLSGTFSGSIYPDDMNVKGRLVDGDYPLHIGFHKGGGGAKQTELVAKQKDVRCGLLVNCRNSVPVQSENANKTTSVGINVHNGWVNKRYSDGCLTMPWNDYKRFIELFIAAYPNIKDWHAVGTNSGKRVGTLIVRA